MGESSVRVLVVADDPLARAGLAAMLTASGVEIAGQATADQDDVLDQANLYAADVVLWDMGWEVSETDLLLGYIADLSEAGMPAVVLVPDPSAAVLAWGAGAHCILLRTAAASQVNSALEAATQALVVLDPEVSAGIITTRAADAGTLVEELTPRETEVLQLLSDGLTNKAIAQKLGISEHTVKFHVNAILGKLQAESRTEAVVRASRLGLLIL